MYCTCVSGQSKMGDLDARSQPAPSVVLVTKLLGGRGNGM
jgi:hypothetical protein